MLTKVTNSLTGRAQYVFSRDGMIISSKKIEHCRLRGVIVVIDGLLKRTDLWDILDYRSHLVSTQRRLDHLSLIIDRVITVTAVAYCV